MEFPLLDSEIAWDCWLLSSSSCLLFSLQFYPMPNPPVHFGSRQITCLLVSRFRERKEFCVKRITLRVSPTYLIEMTLVMRLGTAELMLSTWELDLTWCYELRILGILEEGKCILHVGQMWIFGGQKADCSRLNSGPQRHQVLIPGTYECYFIWQN